MLFEEHFCTLSWVPPRPFRAYILFDWHLWSGYIKCIRMASLVRVYQVYKNGIFGQGISSV